MCPTETPAMILPFPASPFACERNEEPPMPRLRLHTPEQGKARSLRSRLLQRILDNESSRKVSRFRLIPPR